MNKLLHPRLTGVFRVGLFDFYALLAVNVCSTVVHVPNHVLALLWDALALILCLSALITLSGIYLGKLYREFEAIAILVLQLGLALVI